MHTRKHSCGWTSAILVMTTVKRRREVMLGAVLLQQQRWSFEELLFFRSISEKIILLLAHYTCMKRFQRNLIAREEVFYNISESLSQEATFWKPLC